MLALLAAAALAGPQAAPGEVQVAVTRSGLRVETAAPAAPGDLEVATPFGRLLCPVDPVAAVEDATRRRDRLRTLRTASDSGFAAWLAETDRAGLLTELRAGCAERLEREPGALEALEALERWGGRVDPLPASLAREERVRQIWRRLRDASPADAALLNGRLLRELAPSAQGDPRRQLTVAELRQALRSGGPGLRRAACLSAGHQAATVLFEPLLERSLGDPDPSVREAAARAAASLLELEARNYWALVLARGEPGQRPAAALALGRHGGAPAVHLLAHVLSAYDKRAPRRYDFAGHRIHLRRRSGRQNPRPAHRSGLEVELLDAGGDFEVAPLDEATTVALLQALEQQLPEGPQEAPPAEWVDWYLENLRPEAP